MFLSLLFLAVGSPVPIVVTIPPVVCVPQILIGPDAKPVAVVPQAMPPVYPPAVWPTQVATWEYRTVCENGRCVVRLVRVVRER
jgi:hypothetical protein